VFVSQPSDRKILAFSSTGVLLRSWGSEGSGEGQFSGATQKIAADPSGAVYVADKGNNRVQKFSRDGVFLCQWGNSGAPSSLLAYPEAIAVDASGRVFVGTSAQTTSDRLVKVYQSLPTSTSRRTWGAVKSQRR
jgi:DNA-binding beta-propeller fold protein YncE